MRRHFRRSAYCLGEQLLLRIGLLPEIFLDELAELHQLGQLGAAGRGADMADDLLAHLLAVAEALHDLHPVSVSGGIELTNMDEVIPQSGSICYYFDEGTTSLFFSMNACKMMIKLKNEIRKIE